MSTTVTLNQPFLRSITSEIPGTSRKEAILEHLREQAIELFSQCK